MASDRIQHLTEEDQDTWLDHKYLDDDETAVEPAEEADVKDQVLYHDKMKAALNAALPFLEDALLDPCYKKGKVQQTIREVRSALKEVV